jgi:acetyl esterase/lipase
MIDRMGEAGEAASCRTFVHILVALGLVGLMAPTVSLAQMPPNIAETIAGMGRVIDQEATGKLYAPLQDKEPYAFAKVSRDVKYGPHERNIVDIFVDDSGIGGRPVLMFVHGGAFIRGNKRAPGSPFYDNIMVFAARNGMVGVNVEYRLAPEFPWPAAGEDLHAAVRYVVDHVTSYGGDPNRIYLMGHSAGAYHVATYMAHPEFHGPNDTLLAGAILASGKYDLTEPLLQVERAYYGSDPATYAERSSLSGLLNSKTPFMISAAEFDPPEFSAQFALLKDAMCKTARGCVRSIVLPKHNHISEVFAINTVDTSLTSQILEFIGAGK